MQRAWPLRLSLYSSGGGQMIDGVVHIVDDDHAVCRALSMLAQSAGYPTLSHSSAENLLAVVGPESRGCVIADVRMPGLSGLELQQALLQRDIGLPVVIITGHGQVAMAVQALKDGAVDFLEKPFDDVTFLRSIERALAFNVAANESRTDWSDARARFDALTPREREVMGMVVEGNSNLAIGEILQISIRTVENHRARVMDKMRARNLADLMRISIALWRGPHAGKSR